MTTTLFIAYPAPTGPDPDIDATLLALLAANGATVTGSGWGLGERDMDAVWSGQLGPSVRAGIAAVLLDAGAGYLNWDVTQEEQANAA